MKDKDNNYKMKSEVVYLFNHWVFFLSKKEVVKIKHKKGRTYSGPVHTNPFSNEKPYPEQNSSVFVWKPISVDGASV